MNTKGFTMIELIISLALMGVVLGIVLTIQSTVLSTSQQQRRQAVTLGVLTDVTGYIGDRVKSAALVTDGVTIGGVTCQRSPSSGYPCLAVVLPQVDSSGQVTTWELHAFQYVDPAQLTTLERTPGLTGVNVALRESQLTSSCGVNVPTVSTLTTCFAGTPSVSLLSDELVLPGSGTAAFSYDASQQLVTLNTRSVSVQGGTITYLPLSGSYPLKIYARNAH